jgi:hypothetical protein
MGTSRFSKKLEHDVCLRLQVTREDQISWFTPPIHVNLFDITKREQQRAIVIVPYWFWYPKESVLKQYYYPKDSDMYHVGGQTPNNCPWASVAVKVD